MNPVFTFTGQSGDRKLAFVACSAGDLVIHIDTDDVDTYEAAMLTRKMLRVLNDHWNDPIYEEMNPVSLPLLPADATIADEKEEDRLIDLRLKEGKRLFAEMTQAQKEA